MPCNAEAPHLQKLFEKARQSGGLVVGIALANDRERDVLRFRDRHRLTYPLVFDRGDFFDSQRTDVPFTLLAGPDGVVRWTEEGFDPEAFAALSARFQALLPKEHAGDSGARKRGPRTLPSPGQTSPARTASSARP